MLLHNRIESFARLGEMLRTFPEASGNTGMSSLVDAARLSEEDNPWFTVNNIRFALNSLGEALALPKMEKWLAPYLKYFSENKKHGRVAAVMAGNIPAVGFHDFLCILISGNHLIAKLSAQDKRLLPVMAEILTSLDPEWNDQISFTVEKLPPFEAIIATGANNTFRYFEYYFRKYPHLLRHNRNSIAILNGDETSSQLEGLASDIMRFFGLGCRNVSKLFVPRAYDFSPLVKALELFRKEADHSKFMNNYEYFKSIYMVNRTPFHDTGFLLLTPSSRLVSSIGVVNYEEYADVRTLSQRIKNDKEFIQCIVSVQDFGVNSILPGQTQHPELWDYADGIDTMNFLHQLRFP